jgi:hypothetical protein
MMTRTLAALVTTVLAIPAGADAQILPWFNGLAVSAGGGPMQFGGDAMDPLAELYDPDDDTLGAGAFGLVLTLGTARWAVMVPEVHYFPASAGTDGAAGTLIVGTRTVPVAPDTKSISGYTVTTGLQRALVPSGRVWARGGIGAGWISRHISAEDQGITIDLGTSGETGLALSGAAGVRVWARELERSGATGVDVEFHFVTIKAGDLRVNNPSVRIGWTFYPSE